MRRPFLLLVAVAMTAALLARTAAPAVYACTCPPYPTETDAIIYSLHFSDVVVVGTVLELVDDIDEYAPDKDAHVGVERYLKGTGPQDLVADDGIGGGDCGFIGDYMVGRKWVFFLQGDAYRTGMCLGNREATDEYVAAIEAVLNPTPTPSPSPTASPSPAALPDTGDHSRSVGDAFPLAAAAVALPLAFLLGAAFVRLRPGGAPLGGRRPRRWLCSQPQRSSALTSHRQRTPALAARSQATVPRIRPTPW